MKSFIVEGCANSLQSAINAEKAGANRIELCDNLYEGGTTPSLATLRLCKKYLQIPVMVMIRPRGGDFLYSDLEFEIMLSDIEIAKKNGADGVVFGVLQADGNLDEERMKILVDAAKPMEITVHRAIDVSRNPLIMMEQLIDLGVDRILTSGTKTKAIDGIKLIAKMVELANGRIKIMAGSGINKDNVLLFEDENIQEYHLSGNEVIESKMRFQNPDISMGGLPQISEYGFKETSIEKIRAVVEVLTR